MIDRLQTIGILDGHKKHAQMLVLKIDGLRKQIHQGSNPWLPRETFDAKAIVQAAAEADQAVDELARVMKDITAICAALGEPVPTFG